MSRATSIAGVRPLGWLARAPTAQVLGVGVPIAVAWRMARALRVWGHSRRWATGRAMVMHVGSALWGPGGYAADTFACARSFASLLHGRPAREVV